MSFLAELHELHAVTSRRDRDDAVRKCLARIKNKCREEARKCRTSTTVRFPECREWPNDKVDYVKQRLNEALRAEMGLGPEAEPAGCGNYYDDGGRHCYGISASLDWSTPPEAPPPEPQQGAGNLALECGVCTTEKPMSALLPCGHLVCASCAPRGSGICPFCRTAVTGTQALFST